MEVCRDVPGGYRPNNSGLTSILIGLPKSMPSLSVVVAICAWAMRGGWMIPVFEHRVIGDNQFLATWLFGEPRSTVRPTMLVNVESLIQLTDQCVVVVRDADPVGAAFDGFGKTAVIIKGKSMLV